MQLFWFTLAGFTVFVLLLLLAHRHRRNVRIGCAALGNPSCHCTARDRATDSNVVERPS